MSGVKRVVILLTSIRGNMQECVQLQSDISGYEDVMNIIRNICGCNLANKTVSYVWLLCCSLRLPKNSELYCCTYQIIQNSGFSSALSDPLKTPSFKEQKLNQKEVVGKSGRQPCIREVFAMDFAFICECKVVRYWILLFIDNYLRKRSDIIVLAVRPTVALTRAQCEG